jgi:hypothetical protein
MVSGHHSTPWSSAAYDVHEPLLPRQANIKPGQQASQHVQPDRPQQRQKPGTKQQQDAPHSRVAAVDLGTRFLQRLWRILCLVNAVPALILVLISLAETVIVSKIGTISGLFYQGELLGSPSQFKCQYTPAYAAPMLHKLGRCFNASNVTTIKPGCCHCC